MNSIVCPLKKRIVILFVFLFSAILLSACSGPSKEVIQKQREGVTYEVSYKKALQSVLFTLTKNGIAVDKIDKENGFISTLPRQIREEKYLYTIAIRPIDARKTAISVICSWRISPGTDVVFSGIPSAVAKSKSKKLEMNLAEDIGKELAKAITQEADADSVKPEQEN